MNKPLLRKIRLLLQVAVIIAWPQQLIHAQSQLTVSGKVVSESGELISGVNVLEKGTNNGTTTDANGTYRISLSNENATLVFTFIGYAPQEIPVGNRSIIDVSLLPDIQTLQEIVVVGYGTVKKSDLTGSVASVSSEDINRIPTNNLVAALQGQVPGVNIQQRSGNPGRNPSIRIRGANSLSRGANDPLYVVDGMILSGIGTDINMNDVQSIEVLKDASSTAIYGSRGANGVIIVTTKRGSSGKPVVAYDGFTGVQSIIKELDFLNADEFKEYHIQSRQNAATSTTIDNSIVNSTTNTNWSDELYRKAPIQNHTISLRGGTNSSKYYTSVNYFNQDGIIRNTDYDRLAIRFNGDQSISDKFSLSENILLSRTETNGILGDEVVSNGVAWARPTQPVFDAQGKPTFVALPFPRTNPRSLVDEVTNEGIGYRIIANVVLDYEIIEGLTARVNLGTEDNFNVSNNYVPSTLYESSFRGSASKSYSTSISWINENTLNYSKTINENHRFDAIGGVTFQNTQNDFLRGSSIGYVTDGFEFNNLGAGTTQAAGSSFSAYSLESYLGRINYIFNDKLLLTLSGRYDGSSRLSEGNKFAFFPSGAVAWKLSQEEFFSGIEEVSELKLRASWGKTGSQTIAPYSSFATLNATNVYLQGTSIPTIGYVPATVANRNLEWEATTQIDIGLDLGLIGDRIQITADYYSKNTNGLLFKRITPPSSGYSNAIQNIGEVENKGFEFLIKYNANPQATINWNSSFNLTLNRAKVLDLGKTPMGESVKIVNTEEGVSWFPILLGEVPYQPYGYFIDDINETTGQFTFKDINNDGTLDAKDQGIIGNLQPKFTFGFINDFAFKDFYLSVFLQGSQGNDVFVDAFRHSLNLNGNNNILQEVYDQAGKKYPVPNADYGGSGLSGQNTTALIFDGSYIRVKNITLGYTLSNSILQKTRLNDARLYITGTNLITIDKDYPWYDPEVSAGDDVITGWDRGGYANNKSVIIGLKVSF